MTVREVDALRAKRGPSATSEPTHTCFSRAPLFRLGILMPFGEPASASPPATGPRRVGGVHSIPPCRHRLAPPVERARACRVRLPTSVHDLRNRCSTSSGFDVPLPPDSVFHFLRNTQGRRPRDAGLRTPPGRFTATWRRVGVVARRRAGSARARMSRVDVFRMIAVSDRGDHGNRTGPGKGPIQTAPAINPPGPAFARHPRFPSAIRWFSADSPESRRFHGAPIRRVAETRPFPPFSPHFPSRLHQRLPPITSETGDNDDVALSDAGCSPADAAARQWRTLPRAGRIVGRDAASVFKPDVTALFVFD